MARKLPVIKQIAPSVPLELNVDYADGSKEILNVRLSYPFASLAAIESKLPVNMMKPGQLFALLTDDTRKGLTALTVAFWAGLLSNHPEYDSEDGFAVAQSYLSYKNSGAVSDAVIEAVIQALPEDVQKVLRAAIDAAKKGEEVPAPPETDRPPEPESQS